MVKKVEIKIIFIITTLSGHYQWILNHRATPHIIIFTGSNNKNVTWMTEWKTALPFSIRRKWYSFISKKGMGNRAVYIRCNVFAKREYQNYTLFESVGSKNTFLDD